MRQLRQLMIVAAAAALLMSVACKKSGGAASALPATNQVAGWTKSSETRSFTPKTLSDYIDGDAEKYIKAGVQGTVTSDYKSQSGVEATVDIYTMSATDGAKTILDSESAGGATPVALGDAGRASNQSVTFRKGPSLVRIVAYQASPQAQQELMNLAKGLEAKL